jgi:hypothetical protein
MATKSHSGKQFGTINSVPIRLRYRVHRDHPGRAYLDVTRDGKIWYSTDDAPRASHVGDVGPEGFGRDAVCRAANCW